jgi:exonuclease III
VQSSKVILEKIAQLRREQPHLPVILTGDFNTNAWWPEAVAPEQDDLGSNEQEMTAVYRLFLAKGFTDTYRAAGQADSTAAHTFHGFTGEQYEPADWHMALRIDWILTLDGGQRVQTYSCHIVRDAKPPLYPSDHYPVMAELAFVL